MRGRAALPVCVVLLAAVAGPSSAQRTDGASYAGWVPRTDASRREALTRTLTEVFTREQRALGKAPDAILTLLDRPPEEIEAATEAPADELDPELLDAEVRAELRREALEHVALDELALVDLLAGEELPRVLVPLAYEALALLGPDHERTRLLEVAEAIGAEAPYALLERLGTLGADAPAVERRLIELARGQARGSPTLAALHHALERCAGAETLDALDLVGALARGHLAEALQAYDTLQAVAAREGALVADRVVRQLEATGPRGGCDESRRRMLYKVLEVAADRTAAPHLLAWVDQELLAAAARPDTGSFAAALPAALRALAATGDEGAIDRLLQVEAEAPGAGLRLQAIEALGRVPGARAWDVVVWELAERLRAVELEGAAADPAIRTAFIEALRRVTATRLGGDATTWLEFLRREAARREQEDAEPSDD